MGEQDVSIIVGAILQRSDEIGAGGNSRALAAKARAGVFSLGPVRRALPPRDGLGSRIASRPPATVVRKAVLDKRGPVPPIMLAKER